MGRKVYNWDVSDLNNPHWTTAPAEERRFVWSGAGSFGGWLMLLELDPSSPPGCGIGVSPVRKYTWGLDLAGQGGAQTSGLSWGGQTSGLETAGTIGGLLADTGALRRFGCGGLPGYPDRASGSLRGKTGSALDQWAGEKCKAAVDDPLCAQCDNY